MKNSLFSLVRSYLVGFAFFFFCGVAGADEVRINQIIEKLFDDERVADRALLSRELFQEIEGLSQSEVKKLPSDTVDSISRLLMLGNDEVKFFAAASLLKIGCSAIRLIPTIEAAVSEMGKPQPVDGIEPAFSFSSGVSGAILGLKKLRDENSCNY